MISEQIPRCKHPKSKSLTELLLTSSPCMKYTGQESNVICMYTFITFISIVIRFINAGISSVVTRVVI